MKRPFSRILAMLLVVLMLVSIVPINAFAAAGGYDESKGEQDYYNVISERSWDLAPGIQETELVLNNDAGTRRQVLHTAIIDVNNPFVKVMPGTKGMWPQEGNYGTQSTSVQALEAEKLGYGNVVVATNASLSWYTEAYYKQNPHLIGEPLGYSILDGQYYCNSRITNGTLKTGGVQTVVVVNYDTHPITGEARPADMPKVWIRGITDPLTGWEEQAIPVLFGYLVKPDANGNPVSQAPTVDHGSGVASRTFVGVRPDGTMVLAVSDGEQAPFSVGLTSYEMADYMIKMGCVIAVNCDGGGSTTFCSQRPGEDLKVNCNLSDGGERPTSNTFLIVSTAPADGVFARATISSDYDYYTPGSTVTFDALGTDAVGTKVDIPSDAVWQIKEEGMGTIENGVFTSNGTEGTVTAQIVYDGNVVGEHSVTIATPEELSFEQPVVTIPFGKTAKVPVKATIGGGVYEIGLGSNDVTFTTTNEALGSFDGLNFTAVDEANAPADLTSTVTATLNMGTNPTATVQLNIGKGSEVLYDFEDGQTDIDEWYVVNNRKNAAHWDYELELSLADSTNGQVHDGNYSMRLETNGLSSKDSHSEQYAWLRLGTYGDAITLENARSIGFWLYVPEDNIQCWVQGHYMTDSNGDGVLDSEATVSMMESENVYYNIDESGWHYLSMDISAFQEVALRMSKKYDIDPADGMTGETGEVWLALVFHKAINNKLWQENGSINGNYTYYLDNFTVDYSEAVDDRENPVIDKIYLDGTTPLVKRDVVTTTSNVLNLSAAVADQTTKLDADKNEVTLYNASGLNPDTAKVYIDGVEVDCSVANGVMSASATVNDGYHRVKFEICDNVGNKSVVIRVVKVESGASEPVLQLVPADVTLDRIPFGSIYWMNLEASAIENIQTVETVIDLNNVNHWQLDHMELAQDFTYEYTIDEETNTATITFTRTDINNQTGAATLAKIPVRLLYFDTDIKTPGYTAQTYWTTYPFWAQDLKMDVDKGLVTLTNGSTATFSNEEFHVDTEMYTSMANMDKAYFAEHGTTHVHTPVALEDKAATCTENGYTGRTFCEACNSVVEWGTTIPMTEHTYKVVDDTIVCGDCGKQKLTTGLETVDGKGYYLVSGKLNTGWLSIEDSWYYFDTTTYASVETLWNGYVTYEFYPDGKLVSGQWHHSAAGIRYYEGPSYISGGKSTMTWYTIDGNDYCFDKYGYVATGTRWVDDINDASDTYTWYIFDEYGVCQGRYYGNGLHEWNGNLYYLKDGVNQYGMYKVDGEYYYFYLTNFRCAIKNQAVNCNYTKGLMPVGVYAFDAEGKMLTDECYVIDGTLSYYVKGQPNQGSGTVEVDGDTWDIDANGKVLYTGLYYDGLDNAIYLVDGVQDTAWVKNGVILDTDGEIRYYVNGVATAAGLVRDLDGNYYYIDSSKKAVKDTEYSIDDTYSNGLLPAGTYQFGADGKMIDPPYVECAEHVWRKWYVIVPASYVADGYEQRECRMCDVVEINVLPMIECTEHVWGEWVETTPATYTETGIDTRACTLCLFEETRVSDIKICTHPWGDWITITPSTTSSTGVEGRGCTECGITESQELPVLESDVKNGFILDANGDLRYYIDGVAQRAGLVRYNGNFYYINSTLKAVRDCRYAFGAEMANGLLPAGAYDFDADGKMIDPPVEKCNAHFWAEWNVVTAETHETTGLKDRFCYYCGETETAEIPALDHAWSDVTYTWGEDGKSCTATRVCTLNADHVETVTATVEGAVTVEPTCTEMGTTTYTATFDVDWATVQTTHKVDVSALGHTEGETVVENNVAPTCTEDGSYDNVVYCTVCTAELSRETVVVAMLGHEYEAVVTDPTCVTDGYTTYTCTRCGDVRVDDYVDALGHTESAVVVENNVDPTCITDGSYDNVVYCTVCTAELSRETVVVPMLGHDLSDWTETTAPTCTDSGEETMTCSRCDYYVVRNTEPLGHGDITEVIENNVASTCTAAGSYDVVEYCLVCNEELSRKTVGSDMLGHNLGDWTVIVAPTCTDAGEEIRKCTRCDYHLSRTVAHLGHVAGDVVVEKTVEPTCTDYGFYDNVVYCTVCNAQLSRESVAINMLGHNLGEWTNTTAPTCSVPGEATRQCSRCDYVLVKVVEATGHIAGAEVAENVVDATCLAEGSYDSVVYCTVCNAQISRVTVTVDKLDHEFGEWVVTVEPTASTEGEETRTCTICGETETQEIPALERPAPTVAGVDNYTVTLNDIADIKEIRFALGTFTTGSEVKAAEKNNTLDAATVAKYTVDGVFTYDLPWQGTYTFWVRTNNGEYFLYADVNDINTYVTSYGVKITVNDFGGDYKDMWIAEGHWANYYEIKNYCFGFKYQAATAKLNELAKTSHDWNYTLTNPGEYTILIRYNDGTFDVIYHTIVVDVPEFAVDGNKVTISNIPDVKIIRTASGYHETVGSIKSAADTRYVKANIIGDAEDYTMYYPEGTGEITILVEYLNGYKHYEHITLGE